MAPKTLGKTPSSSHPLGDEASIETFLSLLTPLNAQRYTNGDSSITLSSQVTVSPQSLSRTVADSEQSVTDVGNSSIELDESSTDIVTNSDNPEPDSVKVTNSVNPEPDSVSDNTLCNLNLVQQPEVRCTSGTDTKLTLPDATLGDSTLCGLCPGPPGSEDSESKHSCVATPLPPPPPPPLQPSPLRPVVIRHTEAPAHETTDEQTVMQVVPLEYVDDIIHRMENRLIETLENATKNEESARLAACITDLCREIAQKGTSICDLKRELALKKAEASEAQSLRLKLAEAMDIKQDVEASMAAMESRLSEASRQIESLEDINRQLISSIVPSTPPSVDASTATHPSDEHRPRLFSSVAAVDSSKSASQPSGTLNSVPPGSSLSSGPQDQKHSSQDTSTAAKTRDDADVAAALSSDPVNVLFVGNSQFLHVNAARLFCGRNCKVHTLANKTIHGARKFFEAYKAANPPAAIALQVVSNSLENELNPDNIMNGIVDLIAVINRNCPNSHIALGVPLPRLCAIADTTRRYDFCRDKVEQRIKGLANKRQCVTAVSADELATHTTEWFRDNKHLTHQPTPTIGGRTSLGVLVKAFKTALYPLTRTAKPCRQFSDRTDRPCYRHSGWPFFSCSLTRPDADAIPSSSYPTSGLDNAHSSRPRNTHNHMPVDPQPSRPEHPTNTPFIQYPSQFQAQRTDHPPPRDVACRRYLEASVGTRPVDTWNTWNWRSPHFLPGNSLARLHPATMAYLPHHDPIYSNSPQNSLVYDYNHGS